MTTAGATCPRCNALNAMARNEDGCGCVTCGYATYDSPTTIIENRRTWTREASRAPRGYPIPYRGDAALLRGVSARIVLTNRKGILPLCPFCNTEMRGQGRRVTSRGAKSKRDAWYSCEGTGQGAEHRILIRKNLAGEAVGWS